MSHYLFQLTDRVMDQSYELHKTTQGLYIYMESINRIMINNNSRSKIDELLGSLSNSFSKHELKASSLYEIQLAEQDYEMKSLEGEFQSKFTQEYIKDCSIFLNQLSILANFDRQIHKVRDMKGREAFVYSLYGQLFVPKCDFFSKLLIRTEKDKQCFSYVQVEAIDQRRNKSIILFLNSRNFLLDHSNRINCSAVNSRQMINSTHFLIRVGNLVKVQSIADLKLIDLTSQNYDFDNLNFDHHGEIVDGFELIDKLHDKPSSSVDNDLNEKFHILPEDNVEEKHHVIADWAHSISNSISNFWDSITNAIHSFFMSILLIFFIISFVFVLKFCIKLFK